MSFSFAGRDIEVRRIDRDSIFAATSDESARASIASELEWGPAPDDEPETEAEAEARISFVP